MSRFGAPAKASKKTSHNLPAYFSCLSIVQTFSHLLLYTCWQVKCSAMSAIEIVFWFPTAAVLFFVFYVAFMSRQRHPGFLLSRAIFHGAPQRVEP